MSLKNAILRPIEFFSEDEFEITLSVTGPISTSPSADGLSANALLLAQNIIEDMDGLSGLTVYLTDDFKLRISHSTETITVSPTRLSRIMGFSGNETVASTVTADYRPQYSWIPTFYTKDTDRWVEESSQKFYGSIGSDGRGAGIPMTTQPFRTFEWTNERAPNVMKEGSNVSYTYDSVVYYPEHERCFLNVLNSSRGSYLTSGENAGTYSGGVYFIDNIGQYLGSSPLTALPEYGDWDDGDIYFDLTDASKRSNFVFAYVRDAVPRPIASDSRTASYYECTATLNKTEGAPAWVALERQ